MIRYVGIGNLVLDIYYGSEMSLLGDNTGSSVWNDIIKSTKREAYRGCIATAGNDWAR